MSEVAAALASGVIMPVAEVTSWIGGEPLGEVPISTGHVTETAGGSRLGRVEISVPALPEWIPSHPRHPLAAFGQELLVRRGFQLRDGGTIGWMILGRFRIWSAALDESGWIRVIADSIDVRLAGARWIVTTRTTGPFVTQARAITSGVVSLRLDGMQDRAAAARTWSQQESRGDSLIELCDAWGGVPRMIGGQLGIVPLSASVTPTMTIHDGPGGTVTGVTPEYSTDRVPNVVVAMSAPEDETAPLQAMATTDSGPRRWDGPYGPEIRFYSSPLLTTSQQCLQAAQTRLRRLQNTQPDVTVQMVTDPRIRLDAVVRVVAEASDFVMRVSEVRHALTPGEEPGQIRGQVLSGELKGGFW